MSVFQPALRRCNCDAEAFSSFGIGAFSALRNGTAVKIIPMPSVGKEPSNRRARSTVESHGYPQGDLTATPLKKV